LAALVHSYKAPEYIALDGPKAGNIIDEEKCTGVRNEVRKLTGKESKLLVSDVNMGCKSRISSALDAIFKEHDSVVVIEDDILVSASFVPYMKMMLEKYNEDDRVYALHGYNFGMDYKPTEVRVTKYFNMWGWATWRRSRQLVDYSMSEWIRQSELNKYRFLWKNLGSIVQDPGWSQYYKLMYDKVANGALDSWAYCWMYAQLKSGGGSIIPPKNMVKLIGYDEDALHTKSDESGLTDVDIEIYDSRVSIPSGELVYDHRYDKEAVRGMWEPYNQDYKIHRLGSIAKEIVTNGHGKKVLKALRSYIYNKRK